MDERAPHEAKRAALKARYLAADSSRPLTGNAVGTGGVEHVALICADVERTIAFYTGVLGMVVTRIVANRDEPTSTHVFLDMGGGNLLAFFDFPDRPPLPARQGLGAMHHIALRATDTQYRRVIATLKERGLPHSIHGDEAAGSVYFRDPDGILLEVRTDYRRME